MASYLWGAVASLVSPVVEVGVQQGIEHVQSSHFWVGFLVFGLVIAIYFSLSSRVHMPVEELKEAEKQKIIDEWQPAPLVNVSPIPERPRRIVSTAATTKVTVNDIECDNFATYNFLGFIGDKRIENTCLQTLDKYGVGSCGPRGFYGTIDVHIHLEKELAQFFGTQEAIIYASGNSTISSVLPAFSKRGDILVVDEGVHFAVQTGVDLSRSDVKFFKHNDMKDLRRVLEAIRKADLAKPPGQILPRKKKLNRRFIVSEGLFMNTGDICPLPELLELKKEYKFRLVLDESNSAFVLGRNGRGVAEHFGLPCTEVDFITASLSTTLGTQGGFCVSTTQIVDHQRLSGLGYCFSASLPPYLATGASEALRILTAEPQLLGRLLANTQAVRAGLSHPDHPDITKHLVVGGAAISPVIHLTLRNASAFSRRQAYQILCAITDKLLALGICATTAEYVDALERFLPAPSIRLLVSAGHSQLQIEKMLSGLQRTVREVFSQLDRGEILVADPVRTPCSACEGTGVVTVCA
eukprot:gnl/Hemi2/19976_TR6628_c0_g1_i1.p2 gnl/Hemi2/19976_TR6628_c0_g1~~gnl/Hemi2/19976_TR6628_c0_g1_i1.p2  ORF type:complete len:524 (+),score=157.67 gnl/Hemi2/19976_TR6628_c0_g1_i1:154-1725(+)